jgi:hypothetical protein
MRHIDPVRAITYPITGREKSMVMAKKNSINSTEMTPNVVVPMRLAGAWE